MRCKPVTRDHQEKSLDHLIFQAAGVKSLAALQKLAKWENTQAIQFQAMKIQIAHV
jgi:hypothetical protein